MFMRIPGGGYAVGLAAALLVGMPSAEAFAEAMYQFVDRDGVIHFSNVPTDLRYKKIRAGEPRARIRPTNPSQALHETILQTSLLHRLNPALVHAVIRAESAYDPQALSAKGAMGLMQLMPETASLLNVSNPYDPEQNISGGVRYLRYLLDRFGGNLELALAAYNAGESRVSRENRVPHISETRQYVRKVIRIYQDIDSTPLVTRRFVNYLNPN